jgi:dinuclear metal center YbgI/SA1388 family protein
MSTVGDVVALMDGWYPPALAEDWDAVGLTCGAPASDVRRIMFAVDITAEIAQEAVDWGADLLITHHPLLLRGVRTISESTPKGRILAMLAGGGCALFTAHTNADRATDGVSDALARAIGLSDLAPIVPSPTEVDKLVVFVPPDHAEAVRTAVAEAGAGAIGDYDTCSFTTAGEGRFRPLPGAHPAIGEVGRLEVLAEVRIETVVARALRAPVLAAMKAAHPYEEVAYDVIELADLASTSVGIGRLGTIARTTLGDLAARVAGSLPATPMGVLAGGDPERAVRRVAVMGGAGDDLLDAVRRTDADVYVTSDLRHHLSIEFLELNGPALVQVSHWAAESTWLPVVQGKVARALGDTVETRVSSICTDAWTVRR